MSEYTNEEQAAHRRELVKALRSGRYRQARLALHYEDGFCCLGVACDISGLGEWRAGFPSRDQAYVVDERGSSETRLPEAVMRYYGFSGPEGGRFTEYSGGHRVTLSGLNDAGASFDKIADVIEAEPEGMLA